MYKAMTKIEQQQFQYFDNMTADKAGILPSTR